MNVQLLFGIGDSVEVKRRGLETRTDEISSISISLKENKSPEVSYYCLTLDNEIDPKNMILLKSASPVVLPQPKYDFGDVIEFISEFADHAPELPHFLRIHEIQIIMDESPEVRYLSPTYEDWVTEKQVIRSLS